MKRKIVLFAALFLGLLALPATASALEFEAAPGSPLTGGTAQFDPPEIMPEGFVPVDVSAGHFNNDIYEDIAVISDVSRYIYVYLGSADGSLTPSASNPIGANSPSGADRAVIHASDLDKDGDVDLATVDFYYPTNVEVFLNDRIQGPIDSGNESFGTVPDSIATMDEQDPSLAGYVSTYFGDKDGDGDDDLVLGLGNNSYLYMQNADGAFNIPIGAVEAGGPENSVGGALYSTTIGDFNGDGQGDLVMTSEPAWDEDDPKPERLLYAQSDGVTTFADSTAIVPPSTDDYYSNVRSVNLNGDQYDDLIFTQSDTTRIAMGSTAGPVVGSKHDSMVSPLRAHDPSFGDFNQDGKMDAALPRFGDQEFDIGLGDGTGHLSLDSAGPFDLPPVGPARFLPQRSDVLDVNGDGQLDFTAISGHSGDPNQGRGVAVMLGELTGAKLSLKVKTAKLVKRGKKLLVTATLRNTGDSTSSAIVLKALAPKKLTRQAKAQTIKTIAFGKSAVRKFRIPVKRNAKGKFKVKVTMAHKGKTVPKQTGTVRVLKPKKKPKKR